VKAATPAEIANLKTFVEAYEEVAEVGAPLAEAILHATDEELDMLQTLFQITDSLLDHYANEGEPESYTPNDEPPALPSSFKSLKEIRATQPSRLVSARTS
ncbi:MAG TPA: hypothetical protein PLB88_10820, partial [Thermoanaerobaculaceae bacterium]|nr:hypothetical protein [Thermoanaerobaculaceae bacterium]